MPQALDRKPVCEATPRRPALCFACSLAFRAIWGDPSQAAVFAGVQGAVGAVGATCIASPPPLCEVGTAPSSIFSLESKASRAGESNSMELGCRLWAQSGVRVVRNRGVQSWGIPKPSATFPGWSFPSSRVVENLKGPFQS